MPNGIRDKFLGGGRGQGVSALIDECSTSAPAPTEEKAGRPLSMGQGEDGRWANPLADSPSV